MTKADLVAQIAKRTGLEDSSQHLKEGGYYYPEAQCSQLQAF